YGRDNAFFLLRNRARRFIVPVDAATLHPPLNPPMGPRPDRTWSPPGGQDWNGVPMKLTRLRLVGFKSFVEPTDFLMEPGLTGVVGPNGCGKSNLVEALRWVMGETSHKSLRAADMDDVIFSGTNNRPGRNNAEVAIQIDNRARKAPAQFND